MKNSDATKMRITIHPVTNAAPLQRIAVDLHTATFMGGVIGDHDVLVSTPAQDAAGREYRAVVPSRAQVKKMIAGERLLIDLPQPPQQEASVLPTGLKASVVRVPASFFTGERVALACVAAGVGRDRDAKRVSTLLYKAAQHLDGEVLLPRFVVEFVLARGDAPIPNAFLQTIAQWVLPQIRE